MKKVNPKQPATKAKEPVPAPRKEFNINDYIKGGLSKDDVTDFKTAFDMFDSDS